ncbi:MAG TPA: SDR family NAD(P)-dependent oxidoreductase [Thermodesulfobacteriota bacterium]|nr:SDR family NAD(P)-dependent oxidoreductase [Thermodesulfobacteriota bacterium]
MGNRLQGKVAIVVGAGQTPGDTIGNGRAMALLFAREAAKVMLVDRRLESAMETKAMIKKEGGEAFAFKADVTKSEDCRAMADECVKRHHRIDILVNNVGIGRGDAGPVKLSEDDWDRIFGVNLKGMFLTCKYVLPVMEQQERGSIINISSAAAVCGVSMLAYKTSKAGVNALTHSIAMKYAKKGIRVNAIMPGLMKTPMAIEGISQARGIDKDELIKMRDKRVPLKGGMGDAWDTAYAALFLASDEAKFITSVILPVDGGQCSKIG